MTISQVAARVIVLLTALYALSPVYAIAPILKTQAPGFYRMMLGNFEITALNDGVILYDTAELLPSATPEQIEKSLHAAGLADPVGMSYNAYLVNTGSKLVLIDTGTGGKLSNSPLFAGAGRLMSNLRAAGYQPEQVDEIYITHRGQDHIGGLTIGLNRAFPNALVRAPISEFDIFLDPVKRETLVTQSNNNVKVREWIQFSHDLFKPYIQAKTYQGFSEDVELTPGIHSLATHGHTPGHTSYIVESKGQTLLILGDLILMAEVQFSDPSITSAFDADPQAASRQRQRILQLAVEKNYWLAGSHISFPGIGHVRPAEEGYQWIPIHYMMPKKTHEKPIVD